MNIFSFDGETNGLWGEVWAIGAVVYPENGDEGPVATFSGQIDPICVTDPWVIENIVPFVQLPMYDTREDLLNAFWEFWMEHRAESICLADFGSIVEGGLMRACVALDPENRAWNGPYPQHELGTAFLLSGIDPDINRREFCDRPDLVQHDPVDDAITAALCWRKVVAQG